MKQTIINKGKLILHYAFISVLLCTCCMACNEIDDVSLNSNRNVIQITAYKPNDNSLTKAGPKENFQPKDKIHISATFQIKSKADETVYACMQYDENGNWTACEETSLTWPLEATSAIFTAYYIPNATSALTQGNVSNLSFSELSTWAVTSKDGGDPLKATCTNISVGGAVYLQFNHLCTKLTFKDLDNGISKLRLSGENLQESLVITRTDNALTDGLSSAGSLIVNDAKDGEVSFLLPEIDKGTELKLYNMYDPYHLVPVPHKLEKGKHYTVSIKALADNGYSEDYKEKQWNKNPSGMVTLGTADINAYLTAIADGKDYIKDGVQILAVLTVDKKSVVTQLRDVDFDQKEFNPVDITTNIIFNGNNHTVKNVVISKVIGDRKALFGENNGSISNLIIEGITTSGSTTSVKYVGTLVAHNGSNGKISNVKIKFGTGDVVEGTADGTDQFWLGGLAGLNNGTIEDVLLSGEFTVKGNNSTPKIIHIGGVAGQTSKMITNAVIQSNTVEVKALGSGLFRIGGLIGTIGGGEVSKCSGSTLTVDATAVTGTVRAGGFAGFVTNPAKECSSNSIVKVDKASEASVGGLIGQLENTTIDNCHATGEVTVDVITISRGVAGLVGWMSYTGSDKSEIVNCSSISDVGTNNGGLVGYISLNDNNTYPIGKNKEQAFIYNSFSKNGATSFTVNGDGTTIKNCHHNGKNMNGQEVDAETLNAGRGSWLEWIGAPNLYGVPYLNRNK